MVDTTAVLSGLSFAGVAIGLLWKWRFAIIPLAEFIITFLRTPFRQQREAISAVGTEPLSGEIEIVIGDFRLTRQPSQQNIRRLSVDGNVNPSSIQNTETLTLREEKKSRNDNSYFY